MSACRRLRPDVIAGRATTPLLKPRGERKMASRPVPKATLAKKMRIRS